MAVTFPEISAADLALAAADKPMILGKNWLRDVSLDPQWKQGGSWAAGADETDSDGPTARSYDDWDHLQTYPDAVQTTWYFLIDLGSSAPGVIDSVAILNPGTSLSGVQVTFQVADDNAYTSNLRNIAQTTPADYNRIVELELYHTGSTALRYTGVRYARIKFYKVGGCKPTLGEVILSRRRQLEHKPMRPHDPNNLITEVARFQSVSGVMSDYVRSKGRRKLSVQLELDESAYITDFETFWEDDIDFGTLPYLWIDDPATAPESANWMKEETPELTGPYNDPIRRSFVLNALEQGPNFLKLES